jgi:hypothetical protein
MLNSKLNLLTTRFLVCVILVFFISAIALTSIAAEQTSDKTANPPYMIELSEKTMTFIKDWTDIFSKTALIIFGSITMLVSLFGIYRYRHGVELKRINDALALYNEFDHDSDCVLAMSMIDFYEREQGFKFTYNFHANDTTVTVDFNSELFRNSLSKPYAELNEEERTVRFIIDRWLGWLERIFYCFEKKYFYKKELVFYRYWLDLIARDEFDFLRFYAIENTCGIFAPFLKKYKAKISSELNEWLLSIGKSKWFIFGRKIKMVFLRYIKLT